MEKFASVDAYLAAVQPGQLQVLLRLRELIRGAAPGAEERISYGMPGYYLHGPLVYFAAFKNHCSFFVGGTEFLKEYAGELEGFHTAGSTIHFTPQKPLPAALVKKMVRHRVKMNKEKMEARKTRAANGKSQEEG